MLHTRSLDVLALAFAGLVGLAPVDPAAPVASGKVELTRSARELAAKLPRAGWSGVASANGVEVTARNLPLGSADMLTLLEHATSLTDEQRAALDDLIRVTVPEAGWLMELPVARGRYSIGMAQGRRGHRLRLRDPDGVLVGESAFWIDEPTDALPRTRVTGADGALIVGASFGGIDLASRFVSRAAHDALTRDLKPHSAGRVTVYSDLDERAVLVALAAEANSQVDAQAAFLGQKLDDTSFELYLFANNASYVALDALLTGGSFEDSGAFTSSMTRKSYLSPVGSIAASPGFGPPSRIRGLVIHELHHQVARALFPDSYSFWPTWFKEGLAELAASRAPGTGSAYARGMEGIWIHFALSGRRPELDAVRAWASELSPTIRYAATYFATKALADTPRRLERILDEIDDVPPRDAPAVVEKHALEHASRVEKALDRLWSGTADADTPSAAIRGFLDDRGDELRVVADDGDSSMAIGPIVAERDAVSLETAFAYAPSSGQQADLYLGYTWDANGVEFLKLAILPQRIRLFRNRAGAWTTIGTVDYDAPLAVGPAGELTWHPLLVEWRDGRLRAETTGGRWAEFEVASERIVGSRVGLGSYGGTVHFRPPKRHGDGPTSR